MSGEARRPGIDRRRHARRTAEGGFTLLEVVVAITILGVVLGVAMELLGVSVRSTAASSEYTQEVLLARRKIEELSLQAPVPSSTAGTADPFQWSAEVAPVELEGEAPGRLFSVRVRVWRGDRSDGRRVELTTYGLGPETAITAAVGPAGGAGTQPAGQSGGGVVRRGALR